MNRDDIQKLLGGYATGTLTPEEQRALFEAALDDQELFDSLAREEALREVLSDPASRAQLLAAVDDVPAPRYLRWWRPAVVLAAALLTVVGVAVWQSPRAPQPRPMAKLELPALPKAAEPQTAPILPPPPEWKQPAPVVAPFPLPGAAPVSPPLPPTESKAALAKDEALPMPQLRQAQTQGRVGARFAPSAGNALLPRTRAPLRGTVTDAAGAAIPSASVEVKSAETGEVSRASTDERGAFSATAPPGSAYQISASAPGFKSTTVSRVAPAFGAPEPVNLRLDVGAAAETVQVTAAAAPLMARPGLECHLLRRLPGGDLAEVAAGETAPAGATMILRVTPLADGYLRIVDGTRTIAIPTVQPGKVSEIELPKFDRPGPVELRVYFSADPQPSAIVAFNVR